MKKLKLAVFLTEYNDWGVWINDKIVVAMYDGAATIIDRKTDIPIAFNKHNFEFINEQLKSYKMSVESTGQVYSAGWHE